MSSQIATAQTLPLATAPGQRLAPAAQRAWDGAARECKARHGWTPTLTDSHRDPGTQERIFRQRYARGNHAGKAGFTTDVRWWPADGSYWTRRTGHAAAAVPGTSVHGQGLAVDAGRGGKSFGTFSDLHRVSFMDIARRWGWCDAAGRRVNEPWHLEFTGRPGTALIPGGFLMNKLDLTNAHKTAVTGDDVALLQGLLLAHGYGPAGLVDPKTGRPDRKAGATTRAILGTFQVKTNTGDGKGGADYKVAAAGWAALLRQ